jgi:hypothetical protein
MKLKHRAAPLVLALIVLATVARVTSGEPAATADRVVVRVIDGDTVMLDGGERVRRRVSKSGVYRNAALTLARSLSYIERMIGGLT